MKRRTYPAALASSASLRPRQPLQDGSAEGRRNAMLDAAEQRVAEGGLLQTTIPEIAGAAGLSAHTVQTYFGNREALIELLLDRHMDRLIDRIRVYQSAVEEADPVARLGHAIAALLEIVWAYRAGQRVHVAAFSGASPKLVAALKLRQRHLVYVYAGLIAAAVPEAEAQELTMPAALSLMGMVSWHVLWFRDAGAVTRGEFAQLLTHMVVEGVRAAAREGIGSWENDEEG